VLAGHKTPVGLGYAEVIPDMDFETYSEAGMTFRDGRWKKIQQNAKSGLSIVGPAVYSEHPSTEVLSLAYDLKDGVGPRLWIPQLPLPDELFDYIKSGGIIEAWNSLFEYFIWNNVCVPKYGFPPLQVRQTRDAMAKSMAFSVMGSLDNAAQALKVKIKKDADGKRLLNKFSSPRTPTKKDDRLRITPNEDPYDAARLYEYNVTDIKVEAECSQKLPDLQGEELKLWMVDQEINVRGVQVDFGAIDNCIKIVEQAFDKYNAELEVITNGAIKSGSEVLKIKDWLNENGMSLANLDKNIVADSLKRDDLPKDCRRVLEIRQIIGSAAIKKLFAMRNRRCKDDRIRELFAFCGADRTGRFAGRGPQPHNFPNSGPDFYRCPKCRNIQGFNGPCRHCGQHVIGDANKQEWNAEAVEEVLPLIALQSLTTVEHFWPDPIDAVSGCLRGLFIAKPGHDLMCSDYSAIEAVVLACLAGEQWRIDVFNDHGKIYEMSAAKITGIPFEEFMRHKKETGDHHPMRKKVGKVAELASGYQGGLGAWKNFGADKFMSDPEIEASKKRWREESPMIVALWYALEKAAVKAIQFPGSSVEAVQRWKDRFGTWRERKTGIIFGVKDDVLYMRGLSGRCLKYHQPRTHKETTPWGKEVDKITYMGRDSYTNKWTRLDTYGGKLVENLTQATAGDIFKHAMLKLTAAGYPIVLHTHDEITSEIPHGFGSVEEFEKIMCELPHWCADWPIRAAGGWRGMRYRKD